MSLLPSKYLDAVVSIGIVLNGEFKSLATGFLVGFLNGLKDPSGVELCNIFLITNRHVFEKKEKVVLRFNLNNQGSKTYELPLLDEQGKPKWLSYPPDENIDIALIGTNTTWLKEQDIQFSFFPEQNIAFIKDIKEKGVSQGDGIFVLGFPMGLAGINQNYVIVRGGIISRLDHEILFHNHHFYIDATIFPGNSGGPVVLKPEVASLVGTNANNNAFLIGVVSSYLTYTDRALSEQTGDPRIIFMENSGIACVVPMDYAKSLALPKIEEYVRKSKEKPS